MRNKYVIETVMDCKCPKVGCGNKFRQKIKIVYWTDSKGKLIGHKVK